VKDKNLSNLAANRLLVVTATRGDSAWFGETAASIVEMRKLGVDLHWVVVSAEQNRAALEAFQVAFQFVSESARGLYTAINQGVSEATGAWDWFTYINDDDGFLPDFTRLCCDAGLSNGDILYGNVEYVDEHGKSSGLASVCRYPVDILPLYALDLPPLTQQGVLIRRRVVEALGGFAPHLSHAADADFFVRALAVGFRAEYKNYRVAFYRNRPGQLSSNVAQMHDDRTVVAGRAQSAVKGRSLWPARLRFRMVNFYRVLARIRRRGFITTSSMFGRSA